MQAAGSMTSDPRRSLRCVRCGKDFEFSQVRYLPDGKIACRPCLGIVEQEQKKPHAPPQRVKFQCIGCHYTFNQSQKTSCPQCGRTELLRYDPDKMNASNILKMADDPRLDRL